jgi:hypothetical protein
LRRAQNGIADKRFSPIASGKGEEETPTSLFDVTFSQSALVCDIRRVKCENAVDHFARSKSPDSAAIAEALMALKHAFALSFTPAALPRSSHASFSALTSSLKQALPRLRSV